MTTPIKFITINRVIDTHSGKHYLDAIDEDGIHWSAEMSSAIEKWLVYTKLWTKDPQQPINLHHN